MESGRLSSWTSRAGKSGDVVQSTWNTRNDLAEVQAAMSEESGPSSGALLATHASGFVD